MPPGTMRRVSNPECAAGTLARVADEPRADELEAVGIAPAEQPVACPNPECASGILAHAEDHGVAEWAAAHHVPAATVQSMERAVADGPYVAGTIFDDPRRRIVGRDSPRDSDDLAVAQCSDAHPAGDAREPDPQRAVPRPVERQDFGVRQLGRVDPIPGCE